MDERPMKEIKSWKTPLCIRLLLVYLSTDSYQFSLTVIFISLSIHTLRDLTFPAIMSLNLCPRQILIRILDNLPPSGREESQAAISHGSWSRGCILEQLWARRCGE